MKNENCYLCNSKIYDTTVQLMSLHKLRNDNSIDSFGRPSFIVFKFLTRKMNNAMR